MCYFFPFKLMKYSFGLIFHYWHLRIASAVIPVNLATYNQCPQLSSIFIINNQLFSMIWKEISRRVDEPSLYRFQNFYFWNMWLASKGQLLGIKANLVGTNVAVGSKEWLSKKQTAVRTSFTSNSVKVINYASLGLVQYKEQTFCREKTCVGNFITVV